MLVFRLEVAPILWVTTIAYLLSFLVALLIYRRDVATDYVSISEAIDRPLTGLACALCVIPLAFVQLALFSTAVVRQTHRPYWWRVVMTLVIMVMILSGALFGTAPHHVGSWHFVVVLFVLGSLVVVGSLFLFRNRRIMWIRLAVFVVMVVGLALFAPYAVGYDPITFPDDPTWNYWHEYYGVTAALVFPLTLTNVYKGLYLEIRYDNDVVDHDGCQ